ncbi:DUF2939 domain-containing protein [Roseateles sp.]|jgi:hypothetical protein|uniref:DUF2939 domain-containing protein n=1 Tax=Roseateles sp. TaxID=1971397 RepID=UPI0037C7A9DA
MKHPSSRLLRLALTLILLLALAAVFLSPYLTLQQLRAAAEARDAQAFSRHVDFDALRGQLKQGVQRKLAGQERGTDGQPTPASAFGAALAGALLGPMVDALITPESLARLMQGQSPLRAAGPLGGEAPGSSVLQTQMGYESPNRFVFAIARHGELPVELVLHREQLLFWKLAELRLP